MIQTVEISNFKSIKHLTLSPRRINIFIGEPNAGKSNILETIGMMSFGGYGRRGSLPAFLRMEKPGNLFYDENWHENITLQFDALSLQITYLAQMPEFQGVFWDHSQQIGGFSLGREGTSGGTSQGGQLRQFKFYRFVPRSEFPDDEPGSLMPPSGDNLLAVLRTNSEVRAEAAQLFAPFGLKPGLRLQERKVEIVKEVEDVIISYPYTLTSDTLQRLVFYLAAIRTNKDSVIAFEEPEAHAFPYYSKYLAETIALDDGNNQFFIATHNPYILFPILEKAPREDVAVFVTYFEDYQTKVQPLDQPGIEQVMGLDMDVFFEIDRFLKRK